MKNILIILVVLSLFLACNESKQQQTIKREGEVFVQAEEVVISSIYSTLDFSGVIQPVQSAKLSTQLSSQISSINVEVGDRVNKGQILAKMNKANLEQASAQLKAIESEWKRIRSLYESGSVTKSAYDRVKSQYDATHAAFDMAEENTIIKAPFTGEILDIGAKEDEVFSAMMPGATGAPYIVHLINNDTLKMDITIPDRHITSINKESKVFFTADAISDTLKGFVFQVSKSADPLSGAFAATLYLPNDEHDMPSGIYSNASIIIQQADSVLIVPQGAIIGDSLVFKVEAGKSRAVKIDVGIQSKEMAEIYSKDIKPGDTVITRGNVGLKDGLSVKVTN